MNILEKGCGIGCLIIIAVYLFVGILVLIENESDENNSPTNLQQVGSSVEKSIGSELSDEDMQYIGNSLITGETPYSQYYGKNYKCPYSQCSGIRVTAPVESDIVVIIKRNNESGKVIQHGYIKKGETYQFDIPDGIYQTFFYYGEGWNPNKKIRGGIEGGFVKDEIFSKDYPQKIESGIIEYVLQLRTDGNFQTEQSDKSEMF